MPNTLSIRSYSHQKMQHSHCYHQLVLPLRGVINIEVDGYRGKVTPGECLVIKAGSTHGFTADTVARFVVADMDELPENIACSNTIVFSVSQPLSRFLNFVESQLEYQINQNLEQLSYHLFFEMLGEQRLFKQIDHRIREAVEYIEAHLTDELPINELARVACLSPTQFKKLFKEQTGLTAIQYIIKLRMEKAQALLIHTDYPNQIVAEKVGYKDYSAFSRRFSQHFGLPPSRISR